MSEIGDLKSALIKTSTKAINIPSDLTWYAGFRVNSVGRLSISEPLYAGLDYSEWLYVLSGSTIESETGYTFDYSLWDTIPNYSIEISHRLEFKRGITSATLAHDGYLMISVSNGSTVTDADSTASSGLILSLVGAETSISRTYDNEASIKTNSIDNILEYGENLINPNTITNQFLKTDGTVIDNETYRLTDYISVKNGGKYSIKSTTSVGFYDASMIFRQKISISPTNVATVITLPKWCAYIRLNTNIMPLAWAFNAGETLTDEPYEDPTLTNVTVDHLGVSSRFYHGNLDVFPADVSARYIGLQSEYAPYETLNQDTKYADVITMFDSLMAEDTTYITKESLGTASGTDAQGNPYTVYKYTFSPKVASVPQYGGKVRPKILADASMHGFEKNGTFAWYYFLKDLVENYTENPSLAYIRANVDIQLIPVLNPYGFDHDVYLNGNGVNINRNYKTSNWTFVPAEDSNASGNSPMDQPETQIVAELIEENPDTTLYICTHTNGHYYTTGYHQANANIIAYDEKDKYRNKMFNAFKRHIQDQTAFVPKEYPTIILPANTTFGRDQSHLIGTDPHGGTFNEWSYEHTNILGITFEMFNGLNDGNGTHIIEIFSENSKKMCSEILGNFICAFLKEYSSRY